VVAHPGHELRVHGWLEVARPRVYVLTDGSGHGRDARLRFTEDTLRAAGARPGTVFGRLTDRELYSAVLERDVGLFTALAEELADALLVDGIDCVVGDARDGYNPAHDLCRLLVDTAVRIASRRRSTRLLNADFPVTGPPSTNGGEVVQVQLSRDAFARKLAAAQDYRPMATEVASMLRAYGADSFAVECLRCLPAETAAEPDGPPPPYERYGEQKVGEGYYRNVLRQREHMLPLARALQVLARRP
jgi:hypothetical protein